MPIVNTQMYRLRDSDYKSLSTGKTTPDRAMPILDVKKDEKEIEQVVKKGFPWIFFGIAAFFLFRRK